MRDRGLRRCCAGRQNRGQLVIAMTQAECFEQLQTQLEKAGCDSPAFDAICFVEDLSGLPHGRRPDDTELTSTQQAAVLAAADRRAAGEPLLPAFSASCACLPTTPSPLSHF